MLGVQAWWRHMTTLTRQTLRVWLRVLPKVLIAWVSGWLIYQMALSLTAPIQDDHPWLTIVIFSIGLVCQLAGIIIGIRLAGEPAGLWDRLPAQAARIGRDEPLLKVVSLALLPFVGVYSVFNGINEATYLLYIYGARESSVVFKPQTATTILDPQTAQQRLVIGAVLLGCYLLRRGLEATADRTGRWFFGLLGALVEGFFSVVLIFGGSRMLGDLGDWIRSRAFYGWVMDFGARIADWLASLHLAIPEFIGSSYRFVTGTLWPLVSEAMLAPLLWLAVAGLVFGTYTLSIADLWEEGRDKGISGPLGRINKRISALGQRGQQASAGSRAVTLEFIEAFVGDLEDRIIPFVQSLRHVLRIGWPFVGAYVLLYSVVAAIEPSTYLLAREIIGGNLFHVWFKILPPIEMLGGMLGEPLRVSLLAVAMTLTIAASQHSEAEQDALDSRAPGAIRAQVPAGEGRRIRRALPIAALTLASLLAAGAITKAIDDPGNNDRIPVAPGESGELMKGQFVRVSKLDAGEKLSIYDEPRDSMVTEGSFLLIELEGVSIKHPGHSLQCDLYSPNGKGGWIRSQSPWNDYVTLPQLGFTSRGQIVFERPLDGMAGSELRCTPVSFYLAYEPMLVFDLGIDEAMQADLAARRGILEIPQEQPIKVTER